MRSLVSGAAPMAELLVAAVSGVGVGSDSGDGSGVAASATRTAGGTSLSSVAGSAGAGSKANARFIGAFRGDDRDGLNRDKRDIVLAFE